MNNDEYRITTTIAKRYSVPFLSGRWFSINLENEKISLVGIFNGGLFERRKSLASM